LSTETSDDGSSRSIGEILDDLRGDFPDISVSKIRFLESQGLITPERSPSGYRQFTEADLELLRWILRQQRDHYLPLKVIRRRLKEGDGPGREVDLGGSGSPADTATSASTSTSSTPQAQTPARVLAASVAVDETRLKLPDPPPPTEDDVWLVSDGPDPATGSVPAASPAGGAAELWPAGREARYSRNELRQQAGLDEAAMTELESFGLLPAAGPEGYGPEALRIAQACAGFFTYGVEARHLKMYKRFAEQEAAILHQVVPGVSTKDPGAAAKAAEALSDLARLGTALRLAMLRVGIGPMPPGGTGGVPPTTAT
jgi:DNA-binding transcriptional MerR regulator